MNPVPTYRLAIRAIALALASSAPLVAASPLFHQAIAADGAVIAYHLNELEGDAVNDGILGSGYDAEYIGFVQPGRAWPALSGDLGLSIESSTSYLEAHSVVPSALEGNPSFTIEVVFKIRPGGAAIQYPPIVHWGPSDETPNGESVFLAFRANQPDQLIFGFYNGGLHTPPGSIVPGQWYHAVWIRTGGGSASQGSQVILNGVDITAALIPDSFLCCNDLIPAVGSSELRIGRARDLEGTRLFQGVVDEVVVFDSAISVTTAIEHYAALGWILQDGFESGDLSGWSGQ